MSLATPLALLWLAAIIPVVGFYILKIRLRRVPVSTVLFWRKIYDENQPRSIWQRLRHWVSLLAQLLLILLLVGALAEPFFAWETRQVRRIVLIVDNSASMNATDLSPSRLASAKEEAKRAIRGMRFRDELAIVAAGGIPRVVCGFSSHGRTLAHAVDEVTATDSPTRVNEAVELARRLLGERQDEHQREIVVLTDRAPAGPTGSEKPQETDSPSTLRYQLFGANTGNVGITRFQVRRSLVDPLGYEILADVTNASDESVECRLEIDLNDDVVDVVPLKLAAGQRWSQSFEKTSADGGHLLATLDRVDALAADNRAWAVLPKREPIPVTLVSEGNLFIQKVFESNPLVTLTRMESAAWKSQVAQVGLTVFHRYVPESLPLGSVLVIDPRGSSDLWQLGEPVQNPIVNQQDKVSPLLGHVRLDNVVMPEARQVKFVGDEGVKVLARSLAGEPLLATIERPGQKVLLLTVNLDEGDLPLRTAFPILMMNALNWFTENRGELREALPTGAISEIEARSLMAHNQVSGTALATGHREQKPQESPAASAIPLSLIAPDGRRSPLPTQSERLSLGPFDQCGIWRVVAANESDRDAASQVENKDTTLLELACNLMDRDESDIQVAKSDQTSSTSFVSASLLGNRPISFWLIAAAWLLMAIEWSAYQRRVIE